MQRCNDRFSLYFTKNCCSPYLNQLTLDHSELVLRGSHIIIYIKISEWAMQPLWIARVRKSWIQDETNESGREGFMWIPGRREKSFVIAAAETGSELKPLSWPFDPCRYCSHPPPSLQLCEAPCSTCFLYARPTPWIASVLFRYSYLLNVNSASQTNLSKLC